MSENNFSDSEILYCATTSTIKLSCFTNENVNKNRAIKRNLLPNQAASSTTDALVSSIVSPMKSKLFVPFAGRSSILTISSDDIAKCKRRKLTATMVCTLPNHEGGLKAIDGEIYCSSLFIPIKDGDSTIDSLEIEEDSRKDDNLLPSEQIRNNNT